jgi:hypothetical protein
LHRPLILSQLWLAAGCKDEHYIHPVLYMIALLWRKTCKRNLKMENKN